MWGGRVCGGVPAGWATPVRMTTVNRTSRTAERNTRIANPHARRITLGIMRGTGSTFFGEGVLGKFGEAHNGQPSHGAGIAFKNVLTSRG